MNFSIYRDSFSRIITLWIFYQNTERPAEVCDYLEKECSLPVLKYCNSTKLKAAAIYIKDENTIFEEELLNKLRNKYDSGAGSTDSAKAE